jgi:diguanylate cyclase (GGDEF)-like protein/hemerythrin-like metal-binding protein/PAS domain S-box-containing protein
MNGELEIFPWNDNLATGLPEVDEQHKRLVHLLNRLVNSLVYREDEREMSAIFEELADYAVYHFQTEEGIWHQYLAGDPLEAEHKQLHEEFVPDLLRLKEEERNRPLHDVFEEVLSFLMQWLAFHILDSDRSMARIVLAMQSGMSRDEAKKQMREETNKAVKVLIDTVLSMYEALSGRTLQLMKEIIERQQVERMLRQQKQFSDDIINSLPGIFYMLDRQGSFVRINQRFMEVTGYSKQEIDRITALDFFEGDDKELIARWMLEVFEAGESSAEADLVIKCGQKIPYYFNGHSTLVDGQLYLVGLGINITERRALEQEMERLAKTDALTGLPNRALFFDRLEQVCSLSRRNQTGLALLYLDLDGFKQINDTLGHHIGDLLLKGVAERLHACVRDSDTVARIGGDEFTVTLFDVSDRESVVVITEKILHRLSLPFDLEGHPITIGSSIGIATFYPEKTDCDNRLTERADKAMYAAKRAGKNCYRFAEGQ